MSDLLPLLRKHADHQHSKDVQKNLNTPLSSPLPEKHGAYLETLRALLEQNRINFTNLHSIVREQPYALLPHDTQGHVDLAAMNLLRLLQQLDYLRRHHQTDSLQARQLVEHIWHIKERVESAHGDVFIL